ncbi:MAG: hypothetical protein JRF40_11750 [Deltaproteobacteria bacterium]|nr:hypothetical protein [Deltaproteobacteria bacterium]
MTRIFLIMTCCLLLFGCKTLKFNKDNLPIHPSPSAGKPAGLNISRADTFPEEIKHFLTKNRPHLMGILSLTCILILYRMYIIEKNRLRDLSFEEISIIKMGKDVMNMIWERLNPNRKIFQLDDYRKG